MGGYGMVTNLINHNATLFSAITLNKRNDKSIHQNEKGAKLGAFLC
jgi:hypothetical protein